MDSSPLFKTANPPMKRNRPTVLALLGLLVLLPVAAEAATPMLGVPTQIRRGFFTETDLGLFFTTGGKGANPSNAQAYLSLGLGYDVFTSGKHFVALGLGFSLGASAGACFGEQVEDEDGGMACVDPAIASANPNDREGLLSDNWSATTVEGTVFYGYEVLPRFMVTLRGLGGVGFIEPKAFSDTENPVPLLGGGVGVEYATHFDHFSVGLDFAGKYFLGPNVLGVAIAPRVKYTF